MYNSPQEVVKDSAQAPKEYDEAKRSTLISDKTRVHKGGSWKDREFWLDPAQRRYLPEYMSTSYIGFRCATDIVGPLSYKKRTARNPSR